MPSTKLPPLKIDVNRHLTETVQLTTAEQGALFLIYMSYWATGNPPLNCDERLAAIARLPMDSTNGGPCWRVTRKALEPFFEIKRGLWRCSWLEKNRSHYFKVKEAQRNSALRTNNIRTHGVSLTEAMTEKKELLVVEQSLSPTERAWYDFWDLYPKKADKKRCRQTFIRVVKEDCIPAATILQALRIWIGKDQWTKDGGKWIPYPARFLNGSYWEQVIDMNTLRPFVSEEPFCLIKGQQYTRNRKPIPEDFPTDADFKEAMKEYDFWYSTN